MANTNRASFKTTKDTRFANNGARAITALTSRDQYEDVADSFANIKTAGDSLATAATTWDVDGYDIRAGNISISTTTRTIDIQNATTVGRYVLAVDKATASDLTLTFTGTGLTVFNANSNILKGANGSDFLVVIDKIGSNIYVKYSSDQGYADSKIGGQNVNALVKSPTVTEDGYIISWNNTTSEYELIPDGGSGGGDSRIIEASVDFNVTSTLDFSVAKTIDVPTLTANRTITAITNASNLAQVVRINVPNPNGFTLNFDNALNIQQLGLPLTAEPYFFDVQFMGTAEYSIIYPDNDSDIVTPPAALVDGASISWDWNSTYFGLTRLTTTTTAITITPSNVIAGACKTLSINKNTASDVVITLAGFTYYGYDSADYNTTPQITLSGALGNIYDISFLARTATEIGVAKGVNGN
jgi:hypothetical protein